MSFGKNVSFWWLLFLAVQNSSIGDLVTHLLADNSLITEPLLFLASRDAQEVMLVSESVSQSVSTS